MVHAANALRFDATERQRRGAMAAAIVERQVATACCLEEDNRFFADRAAEFVIGLCDFVRPCGGVPTVIEKYFFVNQCCLLKILSTCA
jgi:hypothetical protein